jgi:hypothetical protein
VHYRIHHTIAGNVDEEWKIVLIESVKYSYNKEE